MREHSDGVYFVTGNPHKLREARQAVRGSGVKFIMKDLDVDEPQSNSLRYISRACALQALKVLKAPLIVEDSGLFIHSLGGFPGPYSSYVFKTMGCEGLLKLLRGERDRRARFESVVAFASRSHESPVLFIGRVFGSMSERPRGDRGFGFDPIFRPRDHTSTFGEMTLEEKNALSHRSRALVSFCRWFGRRPST